MEHIFLLAERVVFQLKTALIQNKEKIGYYSFENCTVKNSSFEICFTFNKSTIEIHLSVHPLDMPWEISVFIDNDCKQGKYKVYPNLLKAPDTLGNELATELARDVIENLKKAF